MILGEGVTAAAFFCYFFAAGGKKVRGIFNPSKFQPINHFIGQPQGIAPTVHSKKQWEECMHPNTG
jgi:hypothetical protein